MKARKLCALTGNKCLFAADNNVVPGEGPRSARLVFVGESPGKTELTVKRPFVGEAGHLLDRALAECSVNRSSCWITNACLCNRLPLVTPSAAEWRACRDRLISEVRSKSPAVVVALGAVAIRALLGEKRVKEIRGDIIRSGELGAFVVPTLHPAYVLRNPESWGDLVRDIKKAAEIASGRVTVRSPEVSYTVAETAEDITELVGSRILAFDTEGDVECIGLSADGRNVLIVPGRLISDAKVREVLRIVFLTAEKVVAHNLKYDFRVLANARVLAPDDEFTAFEDTMLISYALDERRGTHGLKFLAREYLGVPDYTSAVRPYLESGRLDECPREDLYKYNATDVVNTFHLLPDLRGRLDGRQENVLHTLLYPASAALTVVELTGVLLDRQFLESMKPALEGELDDILWQMHELTGVEFNPRSWKQVADVLYERLGLPVPLRYSTDADALEMLREHTNHPLPGLLLCYRERHKTLATYVNGLLDAIGPDGRVRTNFNLTGTVTGRLSSSDPVNLQNITRGNLRNAFVATPGYTLIEADLSQAEVRAICWLARDEKLRGVLLSGEDVHTRTACLMHNLRPEEVTPSVRTAAKRVTFGLLYGQSPKSLARELRIPIADAYRLVDAYFSIYPRVKVWINEVQRKAVSGELFYTPFGRTRHFGVVTQENRGAIEREAVNTPVQSLASDITLSALIRIFKRMRRGDFGKTRLLLTVHDSLLFETAENAVEEVAMSIKCEMERPVLGDWLPFPADVKIGQRWGSMKKLTKEGAT